MGPATCDLVTHSNERGSSKELGRRSSSALKSKPCYACWSDAGAFEGVALRGDTDSVTP